MQGKFVAQNEQKVDYSQLAYYPTICSNRYVGVCVCTYTMCTYVWGRGKVWCMCGGREGLVACMINSYQDINVLYGAYMHLISPCFYLS